MTSAIIAYDANELGYTLDELRLRSMLRKDLHSVVHHLVDDDGELVLDDMNEIVATRVIQTADIAEAERLYRDARDAGISARVIPCAEIFGDDLSGYLTALNIEARHVKEQKHPGWIVPLLTEDLSYWASTGIHTALDLSADIERNAHNGVREGCWVWD